MPRPSSIDNKTASPAMPMSAVPSATMLDRSSSGKVENSKFTNSGHDTTYNVQNNYNVGVFPDVIGYFQTTAQIFVEWTRRNQLTGADDSDPLPQAVTTDHTPQSPISEASSVGISDIVPPDPSSLPVATIADRYTRSMLECMVGYPLYEPHPFSQHSMKEYSHHCVNVGDVGFVRKDGTFDFLFNICPPRNSLINPPNLPDGFTLETPEDSETRPMRRLPRETDYFPRTVTRTASGEYICESEGAILKLPEGAIGDEAINEGLFEDLAKLHGVEWYRYTKTLGRSISNGSLYLITSFTKCTQWGIAVFDRRCDLGQGLTFSTSPLRWAGLGALFTRVADPNQGDTPNQCVFLRGYKIMIHKDIFDNLPTRQRAHRIRGGGGTGFTAKMKKILTGESPLIRTTTSRSDDVVLHASFNSSPVHPSDLINAELLSQNPDAKVALTHDDVWCDLLRDNFPNPNYATLMNVARSYTSTIDEHGCISLEKISDETSCLLQGTETPVLQVPFATPDKDYYTFVSPTISLTRSRKLVERILLSLDIESILICRLVNRDFNKIILSSASLQYFLACKAASVIDNPRSPLSYDQRLEALKKREDAWRKLKPMFETTIKVHHQPSLMYSLTGGAFFLGDNNLKDLHYCHLPSSSQDNPQWIRIPGHGPRNGWPGIILSFATAIYEHDLIINVISSDIGKQGGIQQHSLDLVFLAFSTGEYHPLARHPRIHVQGSSVAQPSVIPRIVGDNLALIVYSRRDTFPDKLFIFDWKTGHKRLQHEVIENAYSSLIFISPEFLLVPNLVLSHFEVWHLPPSHPDSKPPRRILCLKLPVISQDYSLLSLSLRGVPSPFLYSIPHFPPRPFLPSPENSIIIANLCISSKSPLRHRRVSYTLVMHRRALLDTIQKWTSFSLLEQRSTTGSVSQYNFLRLRWADWGPPISRWFQVIETQAQWIANSTGQRYAFCVATNPHDKKRLMINVADFNPHNSRRSAESMALFRGEGEPGNGGNSKNKKEEKEEAIKLEILSHDGVFSEDVYMGLKCVVYFVPGEYDFDGVLMDEERLLGLKLNREGKVESVQVLYFG